MAILDRNYGILDSLLRGDVVSADLLDLQSMGFTPNVATSFKRRRGHNEYCCFDIKYIMSENRIFGISKIQNVSLPLHLGFDDNK